MPGIWRAASGLMRVVVVGVLVITSARAIAQGTYETPGFDMPQPVPGATVATGESEAEGAPAITAQRYPESYLTALEIANHEIDLVARLFEVVEDVSVI